MCPAPIRSSTVHNGVLEDPNPQPSRARVSGRDIPPEMSLGSLSKGFTASHGILTSYHSPEIARLAGSLWHNHVLKRSTCVRVRGGPLPEKRVILRLIVIQTDINGDLDPQDPMNTTLFKIRSSCTLHRPLPPHFLLLHNRYHTSLIPLLLLLLPLPALYRCGDWQETVSLIP